MTSRTPYLQVRPGAEADLDGVVEIYNHYVHETAITFDTACVTPADRLPWLRSHSEDGPHRLLVAHELREPPRRPR
jgi:phosphinothricin acetyltransferase